GGGARGAGRESHGKCRRLYRSAENAGGLQDRSTLASTTGKRHRHLWHIQGRHGRHVRRKQNGQLPRRKLRLSRSRHAPLRNGSGRRSCPDSRHRARSVQLHQSQRRSEPQTLNTFENTRAASYKSAQGSRARPEASSSIHYYVELDSDIELSKSLPNSVPKPPPILPNCPN